MGDTSKANFSGSDAQQPAPVPVGLSSCPPGTGASPIASGAVQQQQMYGVPRIISSQFDMAQARGSNPYNISSMANALPQGGYRSQYLPSGGPQPRYNASMPLPPPNHYVVHSVPMPNQQYCLPGHPGMSQYYPILVTQPPYNSQGRPNVGYYQGQMSNAGGGQRIPQSYYPPTSPYSLDNLQLTTAQYGRPPRQADMRMPSKGKTTDGIPLSPGQSPPQSINGRQRSIRGPPRKPRQSGYAIWIGNLPPQTDLMNLVHHVCKEAPGLESLFLISKSNCAFANFKDEPTCNASQKKLHDSIFQSARLVSRLRKSAVVGSTGMKASTGPAAAATSPATASAPVENVSEESGKSGPAPSQLTCPPRNAVAESSIRKDKFFILKSLTVEDLNLSVRNGIWATQSHNEDILNNAFKTADNVYLVFSANKSGEYFGYARMTSEVNDDPAAAIEFAPTAQSTNGEIDLPKTIPTQATEFAPKGRIVDDSVRGTIFWEVKRDEVDDDESVDEDASGRGGEQEGVVDGRNPTKAWGKPFKLEWLSSTKLPFYRIRGLRNPWNSNREVKIARDGTELEPSVGRRLTSLFNRVHSPNLGPAVMDQRMAPMIGYPPVRPYYHRVSGRGW